MTSVIPGKLKVQEKENHPHLGSFLTEVYAYCPECGESLPSLEIEKDIWRCSGCKSPVVSQDYKFCPWCGAAFDK